MINWRLSEYYGLSVIRVKFVVLPSAKEHTVPPPPRNPLGPPLGPPLVPPLGPPPAWFPAGLLLCLRLTASSPSMSLVCVCVCVCVCVSLLAGFYIAQVMADIFVSVCKSQESAAVTADISSPALQIRGWRRWWWWGCTINCILIEIGNILASAINSS